MHVLLIGFVATCPVALGLRDPNHGQQAASLRWCLHTPKSVARDQSWRVDSGLAGTAKLAIGLALPVGRLERKAAVAWVSPPPLHFPRAFAQISR